MYEIEFSEQAFEDLKWFKKLQQNEILDRIEANLKYEPAVFTRNRGRRRPNDTAEWKLRIGKYRVYYDIDEEMYVVTIVAIGLKIGNSVYFRGEAKVL
jgi:mRNA-degrading endonuclease RelE of RelBE toxin-antitoxin system